MASDPIPLLTVGHGTLGQEAFTALLRQAGVRALIDVRRFPASRRHPHVRREAMHDWLASADIAYRWEEDLGGRRSVAQGSPNGGLTNTSFQGYADWMCTPAFRAALERTLAEAQQHTTAVLCAESVWWRCHRRLIADAAVLLHAADVRHLHHDGRLQPHPPTPEAEVHDEDLLYRPAEEPLPGLG